MRVIGGEFKGLKLTSNNIKDSKNGEFLIRPTTDRVKETLFNMIQNSFRLRVEDASFLDCFSGSGSIGIEAFSRGSNLVYFIDKEKSSCRLIKQNLKLLSKKNDLEHTEIYVFNKDFFDKKFVIGKKFDFIYLDPPYQKFSIGTLVQRLKQLNVLKTNSLIIFESSLKEIGASGLKLLDSRKIGKTFISFFSFSN